MSFTRRAFIKTSLASGVSLALPPAIVAAQGSRPELVSGIQIGDVTADRAIIWSRADRPARLVVERSFHEDFRDAVRVRGPLALDTSDYTARVDLTGLPADREVFVRVMFEDLSSGKTLSEPEPAASAPRQPRAATSPSPGRATPRARAGASTRNGAA